MSLSHHPIRLGMRRAPKGTDPSRCDVDQLQAVAATLNSRPVGPRWKTPAETLNERLLSDQETGVAATELKPSRGSERSLSPVGTSAVNASPSLSTRFQRETLQRRKSSKSSVRPRLDAFRRLHSRRSRPGQRTTALAVKVIPLCRSAYCSRITDTILDATRHSEAPPVAEAVLHRSQPTNPDRAAVFLLKARE